MAPITDINRCWDHGPVWSCVKSSEDWSVFCWPGLKTITKATCCYFIKRQGPIESVLVEYPKRPRTKGEGLINVKTWKLAIFRSLYTHVRFPYSNVTWYKAQVHLVSSDGLLGYISITYSFSQYYVICQQDDHSLTVRSPNLPRCQKQWRTSERRWNHV